MKTSTFVSIRSAALSLFFVPVFGFSVLAAGTPAATATDSMGPMTAAGVGIKNFGLVDGRIYRGAQPKDDDFAALKALGVETIIDLRLDAKKSSKANAEAAGLRYVNIGIDGHKKPTAEHVAAFFKTLDENPDAKVYMHCAGGRHRTGSMVAAYRMTRGNWTLDQAYAEMLAYDFYTRNGHGGFKTFVEDYARTAGTAGQATATR
jgi:protein tyrosine/serine phosphatase